MGLSSKEDHDYILHNPTPHIRDDSVGSIATGIIINKD